MAKIKERGKERGRRKEMREERTKEKEKEEKTKKKRTMKVKNVVEEWKIQDEEEEMAKSEKEAKKLVSQRFYKQIYVFRKKQNERMLTRKLQDYAIETKKEFVLRKRKVYLLSRKERKKVYEFISE